MKSSSVPPTPSDEVDSLLQTFRQEGAQRRQATQAAKACLGLILALMLFEAIADFVKGKPVDFANLFIFGSFLFGGCAYGLSPGLRQAVTKAANIPDLRLLGGIIEALGSGDPKLRDSLQRSATVLLEQVSPKDLGLLDDYQFDELIRAVRLSINKRFCKAAIEAMGRIGSKRTLQTLEIFLNDPTLPTVRRNELEPHIRAAMADLRLRISEERIASGELEPPSHLAQIHDSASKLKDQVSSWLKPPVDNPEV